MARLFRSASRVLVLGASALVVACISSANTDGLPPPVDAGVITIPDSSTPRLDGAPSDTGSPSDSGGPSDTGADSTVPPVDSGPPPMCDGAPCSFLDFTTGWSFSEDANTMDASDPTSAPKVTRVSSTATSVTVSYVGANGSQCGCNAQHLVIPLGKSYDCATTTLQFDYTTNAAFGTTSSPSVDVHFCSGACGGNSFYGGPRFMGSEATGSSNCAVTTSNKWPATAQVHEGTNVVPLGSLQAATNGNCSGAFDTVDVHVAAYACFTTDTGTSTLSNVALF